IPSGTEVVQEDKYYGPFYSNREVRDDKVVYFFTNLNRETEIKYRLRALIPGYYHVMPTRAYLMYAPEINGYSEEDRLTIKEKFRLYIPKVQLEKQRLKNIEVDILKLEPESARATLSVEVINSTGIELGSASKEILLKNPMQTETIPFDITLASGDYNINYNIKSGSEIIEKTKRLHVDGVSNGGVKEQKGKGLIFVMVMVLVVGIGLILFWLLLRGK
ncbi:MAG: hypothetical protein ACE5J9_09830, partial [Methanosarcinales archaeon]